MVSEVWTPTLHPHRGHAASSWLCRPRRCVEFAGVVPYWGTAYSRHDIKATRPQTLTVRLPQ